MATKQFTSIFTAQKINERLQDLLAEAEADHQDTVEGELSREQLEAMSDRSLLRGVSLSNIAFAIRMMGGEGNAD